MAESSTAYVLLTDDDDDDETDLDYSHTTSSESVYDGTPVCHRPPVDWRVASDSVVNVVERRRVQAPPFERGWDVGPLARMVEERHRGHQFFPMSEQTMSINSNNEFKFHNETEILEEARAHWDRAASIPQRACYHARAACLLERSLGHVSLIAPDLDAFIQLIVAHFVSGVPRPR